MNETGKIMHVQINEASLDFNIIGETLRGEEKVLLEQDINLLDKTDFEGLGYKIFNILSEDEFKTLKSGFTTLVKGWLIEAGVENLENFELTNYHNYVASEEIHTYVVEKIKNGLDIGLFPLPVNLLDARIAEITGYDVESRCSELNHHTFSIRIVRPSQLTDNNPPHRDVWLNHLRNAVNIYLPICGSNEKSALPILPGSHHWKESQIERTSAGAVINGIKYTVPCVVGTEFGLNMIRPNPAEKQATVFSPYLIHGGGYNLNKDTTRVSLEMRFWKK